MGSERRSTWLMIEIQKTVFNLADYWGRREINRRVFRSRRCEIANRVA